MEDFQAGLVLIGKVLSINVRTREYEDLQIRHGHQYKVEKKFWSYLDRLVSNEQLVFCDILSKAQHLRTELNYDLQLTLLDQPFTACGKRLGSRLQISLQEQWAQL